MSKTPGKPDDLPQGFHSNPTPFDTFEPIGEDPDVLGAEHLLTWCRRNGFDINGVVVGKVQIIGLGDRFPHKRPEDSQQQPAEARYGFPRPGNKR